MFVHGCFWHRHEGCPYATTPSTNAEFWRSKFARNVERDKECAAALGNDGWTVIAVWECSIMQQGELETLAFRLLGERDARGEARRSR